MGLAVPALVQFDALDALDGVAAGTRIVTAALTEAVGDASTPSTSASSDGKLTGEKVCVPAGLIAERIVVTAADGLYVVDPSGAGCHRRARRHDARRADGAAGDARRAGDEDRGPEGVAWILEHAQTAMAVTMSGASATALDLTSTYVKERKQFGRAIGTFQAVSQRAADTYINKEAIKLTSWQAAWRLDTGMPASTQVATAKYWAAQGGQDVVLAAHHLHGGVGVDRDYPLYRYFLLAKQIELDLGSETPTLMRLGKLIAEAPVA